MALPLFQMAQFKKLIINSSSLPSRECRKSNRTTALCKCSRKTAQLAVRTTPSRPKISTLKLSVSKPQAATPTRKMQSPKFKIQAPKWSSMYQTLPARSQLQSCRGTAKSQPICQATITTILLELQKKIQRMTTSSQRTRTSWWPPNKAQAPPKNRTSKRALSQRTTIWYSPRPTCKEAAT